MIVWLASYPRSGNTFLRAILKHVFGLRSHSIYDEAPRGGWSAEASAFVGVDPTVPLSELDQMRARKELVFIKTHEHASQHLHADDKVIYLIRDGRDSVVSLKHYLEDFTADTPTLAEIISGKHVGGKWGDHVRSWNPAARPNTLLLKYELLTRSPLESLPPLAEFIDRKPVSEKVPTFEDLHDLAPKFFRRGKSRSYEQELAEIEHAYFWMVNRDVMNAYGYGDFDCQTLDAATREQLTILHRQMVREDDPDRWQAPRLGALATARAWLAMAHGASHYFRFPALRQPWGGPFNNQAARQRLFQTLRASLSPCALIETGTFRGSTTEYFADTRLPVFSCETDPQSFGFSRARFWRRANVHLQLNDSRAALKSIVTEQPWHTDADHPFFYLDAHRENHLPLADELDIVFAWCRGAIVMIDDFAVPGDDGYGFDDYGIGQILNADYIRRHVAAFDLAVFYPSTRLQDETGARRGCVVLVNASLLGERLASISLLKRA